MAELKYTPVPHDQKSFLAKARARKGFSRAYNALALEYQVAGQMLEPALFMTLLLQARIRGYDEPS